MTQKSLAFEQLPELIQNLVERIESLEKTVREKHQPLPLEGELMSVEDVCKLLGKSKSAVYRTVRCHDIPFSAPRMKVSEFSETFCCIYLTRKVGEKALWQGFRSTN